jgi:hypothetical protein
VVGAAVARSAVRAAVVGVDGATGAPLLGAVVEAAVWVVHYIVRVRRKQ